MQLVGIPTSSKDVPFCCTASSRFPQLFSCGLSPPPLPFPAQSACSWDCGVPAGTLWYKCNMVWTTYLSFQWNGNIEGKSFILLIILQFFFLLCGVDLQVFKHLSTVKLRVKVSGLARTSAEVRVYWNVKISKRH